MKYVVVIALVGLLLYFAYRKLRPYFQTVRNLIETIKQFRQVISVRSPEAANRPEKLAQCARCQTWVPIGRGLTSGELFFCSEDCRKGQRSVPSA